MQAGAIRHRECFAVRYGLRLPHTRQYFRYIDTISGCGVRRNPLRTYIQKNQLCRNLSNVPQAPACTGRARIGAKRRLPRWGNRASFRRPARAGESNDSYLSLKVLQNYELMPKRLVLQAFGIVAAGKGINVCGKLLEPEFFFKAKL